MTRTLTPTQYRPGLSVVKFLARPDAQWDLSRRPSTKRQACLNGRNMAEDPDTTPYEPLVSIDSVRLLKISRANGAPKVKAHLAAFSLNDPDCPPFTTVSYTWGSRYDEWIDLDGHRFQVLESLGPLLRLLSGPDSGACVEPNGCEEDWFWIDSICINQADVRERESQVRLMRQIYHQARHTLVWLGEQTQDTDRAIDFLQELGGRITEIRHAAKQRNKQIPADLEHHSGWASLEVLLQNPWWRRVWTLQEFIIPRELRFHCGPKSMTRQTFRRGMGALEICRGLGVYIKPSAWTTAWNRRRMIHWYHFDHSRHKMSLISLMAFCGDYEVTDPRDRIWAVHGLARDEDRRMIGHPTYDVDVSTLYRRLVERFVEEYGCLDIICYSQIFRSEDPGWPSWIPDWRVPVQPLVVPLMVSQSANEHLANFRPVSQYSKRRKSAAYKASGEELPRIKSGGPPEYLTCEGVIIDHIDGLKPIHDEPISAVESTSSVNTKKSDAEERENLLHVVVRALVLDRMDKFLEMNAPATLYAGEFKRLVAACDHQQDTDLSAPSWFEKWWGPSKDTALRIRGFTLEDLCVSNSKVDTSRPILKTAKSFFSRLRGTMTTNKRRPVVTTEGHFGVAPRLARKGDAVCVLFGCNVPVVLRPQLDSCPQDASVFQFIGECYLDGFMNGEALQPEAGKPIKYLTIK